MDARRDEKEFLDGTPAAFASNCGGLPVSDLLIWPVLPPALSTLLWPATWLSRPEVRGRCPFWIERYVYRGNSLARRLG